MTTIARVEWIAFACTNVAQVHFREHTRNGLRRLRLQNPINHGESATPTINVWIQSTDENSNTCVRLQKINICPRRCRNN